MDLGRVYAYDLIILLPRAWRTQRVTPFETAWLAVALSYTTPFECGDIILPYNTSTLYSYPIY